MPKTIKRKHKTKPKVSRDALYARLAEAEGQVDLLKQKLQANQDAVTVLQTTLASVQVLLSGVRSVKAKEATTSAQAALDATGFQQ